MFRWGPFSIACAFCAHHWVHSDCCVGHCPHCHWHCCLPVCSGLQSVLIISSSWPCTLSSSCLSKISLVLAMATTSAAAKHSWRGKSWLKSLSSFFLTWRSTTPSLNPLVCSAVTVWPQNPLLLTAYDPCQNSGFGIMIWVAPHIHMLRYGPYSVELNDIFTTDLLLSAEETWLLKNAATIVNNPRLLLLQAYVTVLCGYSGPH